MCDFRKLLKLNHIEHYGLLREKESNGYYERVETHYSWNSNHIIGLLGAYYCLSSRVIPTIITNRIKNTKNLNRFQMPLKCPRAIQV